jgi:hypothetical protein
MRCKALKSKAHSLGWCYWRYNTPHRPFAQPPSFYHLTTLTLSFSNISSTFALYHHHIFPFTESSSRAASCIILVADRREIIVCSFRGKLLIPCHQVTLGSLQGLSVLGKTLCTPCFCFRISLARLVGAIPYYTRPRFFPYVLHFVGGYPQFEHLATTSYRQLLSLSTIYPCWLKGKAGVKGREATMFSWDKLGNNMGGG